VSVSDDPYDLSAALAVAADAHAGQVDKSSGTPYLGHLLQVASTVIRAGGTADQARAALLHDTIEDGGASWWPKVRAFGPTVEAIVQACSDAEPADGAMKAPWMERKLQHYQHLLAGDGVPDETYLVVAADKLDAVERTLTDLDRAGDAFWDDPPFKGGRFGSVWYWRAMSNAVSRHLGSSSNPLARGLADELASRVAELARRSDRDGQGIDTMPLGELLELAGTTPYPDGVRFGEGGVGS
jgi:hypothetical protein